MNKVKSWIFEPEFEVVSREKLRKIQEERLRKIVTYSCDRIPLYRKKFKDSGVSPDYIKTLDDSEKIP